MKILCMKSTVFWIFSFFPTDCRSGTEEDVSEKSNLLDELLELGEDYHSNQAEKKKENAKKRGRQQGNCIKTKRGYN